MQGGSLSRVCRPSSELFEAEGGSGPSGMCRAGNRRGPGVHGLVAFRKLGEVTRTLSAYGVSLYAFPTSQQDATRRCVAAEEAIDNKQSVAEAYKRNMAADVKMLSAKVSEGGNSYIEEVQQGLDFVAGRFFVRGGRGLCGVTWVWVFIWTSGLVRELRS